MDENGNLFLFFIEIFFVFSFGIFWVKTMDSFYFLIVFFLSFFLLKKGGGALGVENLDKIWPKYVH